MDGSGAGEAVVVNAGRWVRGLSLGERSARHAVSAGHRLQALAEAGDGALECSQPLIMPSAPILRLGIGLFDHPVDVDDSLRWVRDLNSTTDTHST